MPNEIISMDETFRAFIDQNAEDAWRSYCEANGLDPDAVGDERLEDMDYPF